MFAWWGRLVYRYRFIVIAVLVGICLASGAFGISLGKHVTQSGLFDDSSDSVQASLMADGALGRDTSSHIVALYTAPEGKTVDDPEWQKKILDNLAQAYKDHPDKFIAADTDKGKVIGVGYLRNAAAFPTMADKDKKHTFLSISLTGDNDDVILQNYKDISSSLYPDGVDVKLAGLEPVAAELTGTVDKDIHHAEMISMPLVVVVAFFVFGGLIAAGLPLMVGGLAIAGALGIMRTLTLFMPINFFAQPVVTLIGLGIAVDYSLFMVSRFREEIAEGYDVETAVRRTVITSGRTVMFSAVLIVGALMSLLVFPQQVLKSLTYAGISSVFLAAFLAVTVLPAALGILGRHVDALSIKRFSRTKSKEEIEAGMWGRVAMFSMKRPLAVAIPIVVALLLLIIPLKNLALGGFSEKYLPPTNPTRLAQQEFDQLFPTFRTEPITIVTKGATDTQMAAIRAKAMDIPGFVAPDGDKTKMWQARPDTGRGSGDKSVKVIQNALVDRNSAAQKVKEIRDIPVPKGVVMHVGGTPALEQDSISVMFEKMPLMVLILISVTTVLMFLAFGSLVLPIKAAVMSALSLGSTLGILTWVFVDGHFSTWMNFTPGPMTAPIIGLIIAVIYGLSSDYEVFLLSRMIEARHQGLSTTESVRVGTANSGRIITAAALVLIVVLAAFVLSDLVIMKYLAVGIAAALILDATVVRMMLIPAVMKLLGDDCWWAPAWMKRIQVKLGLGEVTLADERKRPTGRDQAVAAAASKVGANARTTKLAIPSERTRLPAAAPSPSHDPTAPTRPAPEPPTARVAAPKSPAAPTAPVPTGPAPATEAIPTAQSSEPQTTRMSLPGNNIGPSDAPTTRSGAAGTHRPDRRNSEREIESWLGELRGPKQAGHPSGPIAKGEPTNAIPSAGQKPVRSNGSPGDEAATTAMPIVSPDAAPKPRKPRPPVTPAADQTEAMPAADQNRNADENTRRSRGGSVSAQDLLRREGRRI